MANLRNYVELFADNEVEGAISEVADRSRYMSNAIQVIGASGDNTVNIELSLDGANWVTRLALSADGITSLSDDVIRYMRAKRTAGSEPLTVILFSTVYEY